jgi:hypothetical protein
VGEVSSWMGDLELETLGGGEGDLSIGGSLLRELVHWGGGVAPEAARDWAEAVCSELSRRRVENLEWRVSDGRWRAKKWDGGHHGSDNVGAIGARHSTRGLSSANLGRGEVWEDLGVRDPCRALHGSGWPAREPRRDLSDASRSRIV